MAQILFTEEEINQILDADHLDDANMTFNQMIKDKSNRLEKLVMPTLTGDLENDLHIIYKNGKPHGIRDRSGYLLFFPEKSRYDNQPERYKYEMQQQNILAEYLLKQLSKCSA